MGRFNAVLAFAFFATIVSAGNIKDIEELSTEITFVDNINVYRAQFPFANISPLAKGGADPRGQTRYTLGTRVNGDRIIARGSKSYQYPTLQDVQLKVKYPKTGSAGSIVTFAEVIVDQTSTEGNAYVVSGGIGQRLIEIVIEAKRTLHFKYSAAIYGY